MYEKKHIRQIIHHSALSFQLLSINIFKVFKKKKKKGRKKRLFLLQFSCTTFKVVLRRLRIQINKTACISRNDEARIKPCNNWIAFCGVSAAAAFLIIFNKWRSIPHKLTQHERARTVLLQRADKKIVKSETQKSGLHCLIFVATYFDKWFWKNPSTYIKLTGPAAYLGVFKWLIYSCSFWALYY